MVFHYLLPSLACVYVHLCIYACMCTYCIRIYMTARNISMLVIISYQSNASDAMSYNVLMYMYMKSECIMILKLF